MVLDALVGETTASRIYFNATPPANARTKLTVKLKVIVDNSHDRRSPPPTLFTKETISYTGSFSPNALCEPTQQ